MRTLKSVCVAGLALLGAVSFTATALQLVNASASVPVTAWKVLGERLLVS